jgi:predicted transcriptional regulator of viral defense system
LLILTIKGNELNYNLFRERFSAQAIFSINDIHKAVPEFDTRRLIEWQKKGYIKKVINRWYRFAEWPVDEMLLFRMANSIYRPSYISMEAALHYYGWIPEAVFSITSLSTKKTQSFETPDGSFSYRHIKPALFFGYQIASWQGFPVKIAEKEKLLLDYLYLNPSIHSEEDIEAIRLNPEKLKDELCPDKYHLYLKLFRSKALNQRSSRVLQHLELC